MGTQDSKAIVRRYYEEVANQRNLVVADELFAPDFKLFPDSQPPYGPEGVKAFISWLCIATFPDLEVTIENLVAEGEVVAAAVTLHATQTVPIDWLDELGGIAPTGKRFSVPEFVFWWVVDGKITARRIIFDTWAMLQQLGVNMKLE